jgi:hypothetical protein
MAGIKITSASVFILMSSGNEIHILLRGKPAAHKSASALGPVAVRCSLCCFGLLQGKQPVHFVHPSLAGGGEGPVRKIGAGRREQGNES